MMISVRPHFLSGWAACLVLFEVSVAAGAPGIINYQNRLTNSQGNPITTPVNLTFTFWDAPGSGNQLGNGFFDMDSVSPNSNGVCSTDVGDDPGNLIPSSIFRSENVWLNVNVGGIDVGPRTRITSSAFAINALPSSGAAYEIVKTTNNATENGTNLIEACNRAKVLLPHGQGLSASNRAVVLVPPGQYDLGTNQLVMDAYFVDLVGVSTARDDQHIYGITSGSGYGVLRQTADDVHIENLWIECTRASGSVSSSSSDPAAYFPDSGMPATVVRNCRFSSNDINAYSMRIAIAYAGSFENCSGGYYAFGGFSGGSASGTFTNCTGADRSFAGYGGTASGTFTYCTGGVFSFAAFGTASGNFLNCTGADLSFGRSGTASGNFTNCTGGSQAFGGQGLASGVFNKCVGGDFAFAGGGALATGGRFYYCSGGFDSFGTLGSPTVLYCIKNGAAYP